MMTRIEEQVGLPGTEPQEMEGRKPRRRRGIKRMAKEPAVPKSQ